MISLAEAQEFVLARVSRLGASFVALDSLLGRVLAQPVVSTVAVPPFANTGMDGFAVRSADVASVPVTLEVIGTIAAGYVAGREVGGGQAMRIMTGAPIPDGADAVVMVERCTVETDAAGIERVTISESVDAGRHVRVAGDDIAVGDEVIPSGTLVTPGVIGVLCTVGLTGAVATARPVVGVMSTGDELVEPPTTLAAGQIYESNRRTLMALLTQSGFDVVDLGLVADDDAAIEAALRDGAARCDAVVTSGGVSMGDFDLVKVVLDRIGDMRWMQVAIKPAKPLAFGTIADGGRHVPVFGLPGNPVSSMVSFELFARPALRKMAGHGALHRPRVAATAGVDMRRRRDGRTHFPRMTVTVDAEGGFVAHPSGAQGSHQLSAMVHADALAVLGDGDGVVAGDRLDIMILGGT